VASGCVKLSMYAVLDFSRLPIAVMYGTEKIVCYVNPAFCSLLGKNAEEMVGMPFAKLMPDDSCLQVLDQVYRNGKSETHAEQAHAKPHPIYWSYEIWPTWGETPGDGDPVGVVLQVTETAPFHSRAAVMNEALLLCAVRQHELMEEAESLNRKLSAEISERQRAELEIEQLAFYDSLTDLPNRRLLMDRLHHATLACCRTMHHGAIIFIDLDHFKRLNDSQGHHLGDLLLQQIAQRLKECVREDDTVARLGGDEFVVMLKELSENTAEAHGQAKKVAVKVLASLDQPYLLAGHDYHGSASVGIALFSKNRESVDDLLKRADLAQYRAKSAGGRSIRFFDPEMEANARARAALEADLRRAVQRGQFRLHYQPQVNDEGDMVGAEALLRWEHPDRGLLLPSEFIAFAEDHGVMESIGLWVAETVCKQLMEWGRRFETSHLTLAINVSAREFGHPAFVTRMLALIDQVGADPKKLIMEFTERVMFGPFEETLVKMDALKDRGVSFALDDFGIGFSSLASLKNLPLSQLKIDRSFVRDVLTNPADALIVSAVIALGQSLGLSVVAEGVETEEQRQFLRRHGCLVYQGFLFGQPQPAENLALNVRTTESLSVTYRID
jgi:diguanylate cyclase (GGDEF)-like protein